MNQKQFHTSSFLRLIHDLSDSPVKAQHIKTAESDERIDYSCEPGPVPEKEGDQVKLKEADEPPDYASDDPQREQTGVKPFHVFSPP